MNLAEGAFEVEEERISPVVGIGVSDELCFFHNEDDHWCFNMTPPVATLGWKWYQTWDTTTATDEKREYKYYQWELWFGGDAQGYVVTDLYLQNLISFEGICNLAQFASHVLVSVTITGDYKMCLGVGYDIEEIILELKSTFKFWDCAMTILDDLLDFSDTWTGRDAKYLDKCSQSETRTITFFDDSLRAADEKKLWWGTTNPTATMGCWTLPTAPYPGYTGQYDFSRETVSKVVNYFLQDDFFVM